MRFDSAFDNTAPVAIAPTRTTAFDNTAPAGKRPVHLEADNLWVKATATTNVDLGAQRGTIDGVSSWTALDAILLTAQTDPTQNGLWVADGSQPVWRRPAAATELGYGRMINDMVVAATSGTSNGQKPYKLTTADPIIVATTEQTWTLQDGCGPAADN